MGTAQKKPTENCQTGNWKHDEDVRVLEARVLVKGIQRLAGTFFVSCTRQLLLCDSTGAVLSFQRRRSSSFKLLTTVRRFQAYALALGIRTSLRWVPSELNEADRCTWRPVSEQKKCRQTVWRNNMIFRLVSRRFSFLPLTEIPPSAAR